MELKGKLAVITGGSRGIGAGISVSLATAGADVAVIYRTNEDAYAELRTSLPTEIRVRGYQVDVTNYEKVKTTFAQIYEDFGTMDILVNCAGRAPSTSSVARGTVKEWLAVINVDLHAAYYCSKEALEYMHIGGAGHIVNISSVVASTCHAGSASYAASKAALEAFTKVLAREEARNGIRVNAIAPGLIVSEMSTKMTKAYGEQRMKDIYESIPLGRFGCPSDVGELVAYIVSPKGNYITGQVFGVDGGMYYWKSTFADL